MTNPSLTIQSLTQRPGSPIGLSPTHSVSPWVRKLFVSISIQLRTGVVLKRSKALFTVKAGPYTLLSNFSASLTADALSLQSLVKEYYVDVEEDQPLIITFIPSRSGNADEMYAFVNGIEIISIPAALYHTCEGTSAAQIVGKSDRFTVDKSFALEKVHRLTLVETPFHPQKIRLCIGIGMRTRIIC
ncbi:hypothetical protein RHGRI_028584 [Rhododendron griersonianum]|uniref:Uncharacterized protein n=1 Tax=Rhododendron griersonianum TaxID=479676 RepID=A0AAV6IGE7_9ERIC|nr:hypothetical protein RHGRI_028584 [Rhododendron griersonianum]